MSVSVKYAGVWGFTATDWNPACKVILVCYYAAIVKIHQIQQIPVYRNISRKDSISGYVLLCSFRIIIRIIVTHAFVTVHKTYKPVKLTCIGNFITSTSVIFNRLLVFAALDTDTVLM